MKINLIAIGTKMPSWVEEGIGEYRKRLPGDFKLNVIELPLPRRSKSASDINRLREAEGSALLGAINKGDYVVALDVKGESLSTEAMAKKVNRVREEGRDMAWLVGGPDGLSSECLERANATWSLSALTMPHTIVRIVVAEQVYRVWSVLKGHPYHRE